MARGRGRQPPSRGRGSPVLEPWPLDHAPTPTPATIPTAAATAPGATRPSVREFFCYHCRRTVAAADCPDGWLRVQVRDADQQRRDGRTFLTTGLFCGMGCLAAWATAQTTR